MARGFKQFTVAAALLCMAAFVSSVRADDKIDNPAYQGWKKFKAGTSVKYATESEAMGNKSNMETSITMTDISDDKATVENKMSMVVQGNKMDLPANKTEIPARISKTDMPATQPTADAPETETGTEDVKVGDKTYSCTWTKLSIDQNGMKTTSKTWTCPDVPGGLVKMESESTGTVAAKTSMTLVSVDAK